MKYCYVINGIVVPQLNGGLAINCNYYHKECFLITKMSKAEEAIKKAPAIAKHIRKLRKNG